MNNQDFMNYLKELRKKNFLKEAISESEHFLEAYKTSTAYDPNKTGIHHRQNELIQLSGRYSQYLYEKNNNTADKQHLNIELAKIREAFGSFHEKLQEIPDFEYKGYSTLSIQDKFELSKRKARPFFAAALILVCGASIWLYVVNNRFSAFDLLLSTKIVTNPSGLTLSQEKEVEVGVEAVDENYTAKTSLDKEGKAFFHHIPPEMWKKKIRFNLHSQFFQLNEPTRVYQLNMEKIDLDITPKLISKISGRLISNHQILSGAKVWIGEDTSLNALTDAAGRFFISIPKESQKAEFTLLAAKQGYRFNHQMPRYEETIDAQEAEGELLLNLEEIPKVIISQPPPPPQASLESSPLNAVVFKLRYEGITRSIPFPDNRTVGQLKAHLANDAAKNLARGMKRCTLRLNGLELSDLQQSIKSLNVQAGINDLISFECNGGPTPMVSNKEFIINGLESSKKLVVFVNGTLALGVEVSNGILFRSGYFSPTQNNEIVIDDLLNKRSTKLKNIRYTESFNRLYITVGAKNGISVRQ